MSDSCALQVTVRKCDIEKFMACFEEDTLVPLDSHRDGVTFEVEQAINALELELEEAAEKGCVFYGCHGPGWEITSARFVSFDGVLSKVRTDRDDMLIVGVSDRGMLCAQEIARIAKHLELERKVEEAIIVEKKSKDG